MITLIGITGAIGHGKSTLAEAFRQAEPTAAHLESFQLIAEVVEAWQKQLGGVPANDDLDALNSWVSALVPILRDLVHLDISAEALSLRGEEIVTNPVEYEKLFAYLDAVRQQPEMLTQQITEANKPFYRPILQWVGGYVISRAKEPVWYKELIHRAQALEKDGVNLCILSAIRYPADAVMLTRAGGIVIKVERPTIAEQDAADPTERERDSVNADVTVYNNGSLEELTTCAATVLADIRANNVKTEYWAHS